MSEEWKEIKGYPGYFVSNTGKVASKNRKNGLLDQRINRGGYCVVSIGGRRLKMPKEHEFKYICCDCHSRFDHPAEYDDSLDTYRDPWSSGWLFVCPECGSEHFNEV